MNRRWMGRVVLCGWMLTAVSAAWAALDEGQPAPDFTVQAATGGRVHAFSLARALQQGPVVVYFYPKAFTSGCTLEAHQFSEAMPAFRAAGTQVIGLSTDPLPTLQRFSLEACRSAFAVGSDDSGRVMRAYDAQMTVMPDTASRISYLITPDGRVAAVHRTLRADGHAAAMLKAAQQWRAAQPR